MIDDTDKKYVNASLENEDTEKLQHEHKLQLCKIYLYEKFLDIFRTVARSSNQNLWASKVLL